MARINALCASHFYTKVSQTLETWCNTRTALCLSARCNLRNPSLECGVPKSAFRSSRIHLHIVGCVGTSWHGAHGNFSPDSPTHNSTGLGLRNWPLSNPSHNGCEGFGFAAKCVDGSAAYPNGCDMYEAVGSSQARMYIDSGRGFGRYNTLGTVGSGVQ